MRIASGGLLAESRERFKIVVQINKDIWPHEYEWWAEKGWI